ncbi:hypothetical protein [Sphaerimonospora thailandensis]|nr:hypothetical protein [Sphaerimonospora thailandensis]
MDREVRKPSENVLDSIAAALNVDPLRLLNGTGRRDGRVRSCGESGDLLL